MGKINKNIDRITNRIFGELELLVFIDGHAKHILVNTIEQNEEIVDDGQNPRKIISLKGLNINKHDEEEIFSVTYVVSMGGTRIERLEEDEEEILFIPAKSGKKEGPSSSFN